MHYVYPFYIPMSFCLQNSARLAWIASGPPAAKHRPLQSLEPELPVGFRQVGYPMFYPKPWKEWPLRRLLAGALHKFTCSGFDCGSFHNPETASQNSVAFSAGSWLKHLQVQNQAANEDHDTRTICPAPLALRSFRLVGASRRCTKPSQLTND